jgi:hypothetical protein
VIVSNTACSCLLIMNLWYSVAKVLTLSKNSAHVTFRFLPFDIALANSAEGSYKTSQYAIIIFETLTKSKTKI